MGSLPCPPPGLRRVDRCPARSRPRPPWQWRSPAPTRPRSAWTVGHLGDAGPVAGRPTQAHGGQGHGAHVRHGPAEHAGTWRGRSERGHLPMGDTTGCKGAWDTERTACRSNAMSSRAGHGGHRDGLRGRLGARDKKMHKLRVDLRLAPSVRAVE